VYFVCVYFSQYNVEAMAQALFWFYFFISFFRINCICVLFLLITELSFFLPYSNVTKITVLLHPNTPSHSPQILQQK